MKRLRQTEDVDLRDWRLEIRFLFRILSRVHGVTKRTGMRAIKCLGDRCAEGYVLGVLNDHRCPGYRLKRNPVQANRATKHENRRDAAGAAKHDDEASSRVANVNASVRLCQQRKRAPGRFPELLITFASRGRKRPEPHLSWNPLVVRQDGRYRARTTRGGLCVC
jgi:hypothetical protein